MSPPLDLWPSLAELKSDYRTATGEQRRIRLGDVAVQMNTQTSIAIPSKADVVDHVRLVAGEALFTMPSQSDRQLVVAAGSGRTVASKARFDVRNVGSTVCVTCFDGLVQVEQGIQKTTVGAGQQFNYNETGFGKMMVVDPHEAASGKKALLSFDIRRSLQQSMKSTAIDREGGPADKSTRSKNTQWQISHRPDR